MSNPRLLVDCDTVFSISQDVHIFTLVMFIDLVHANRGSFSVVKIKLGVQFIGQQILGMDLSV